MSNVMKVYNATIEVATRQLGDVDAMIERLAPFHAALGISERGWASATLSLPADSLVQATAAAAAVMSQAFGADAIACEVMTEEEFDARQGWATMPELVSVSEAAELLGVSRQRVLQRIDEKTLPATRVGRDYVIARSAVMAELGKVTARVADL